MPPPTTLYMKPLILTYMVNFYTSMSLGFSFCQKRAGAVTGISKSRRGGIKKKILGASYDFG